MATPGNQQQTHALSDRQQEAVDYSSGPLIVLAGPGTGKTRVIIARIVRLLEEGAAPASILAVTFTVKATTEMRERLAEQLAGTPMAHLAEQVNISTLHGLGAQIVRRFGDMIGVRSGLGGLTLMDAAQQKRLLRSLIRAHDLFGIDDARGRDGAIDAAIDFIGTCLNAARTPADALAYARKRVASAESNAAGLAGDDLAAERYKAKVFAEHARLFELYEKACLAQGLATFDHFLSLPLAIFAHAPIAVALIRTDIKHVVVDEFQDLNTAQIELLHHLCPPVNEAGRPPDLCIVGDDDQAIYGFRGSDPRAFDRFTSIWKDPKIIELVENYRSAPGIVAAANAIIEEATERFAPDKTIVAAASGSADDGKLLGVTVPDDDGQGTVIAAIILDDRRRHPERKWSDYAVIARTISFRDQLGTELEFRGIPIDIRIPIEPRADSAVEDLFSWMGAILDHADGEHTHRLLVRPLLGVEPLLALKWKDAWRRGNRSGDPDDPLSARVGFADWLAANHGGERAVKQLMELLGAFREAAAVEPADRVIERIIRDARLATGDGLGTDLLEPRERSMRVRRMVQVIRFARSRQPFLDPPGRLAEFLRYYGDLDKEGQRFEVPNLERLDRGKDAADEAGRPDAVRVLTAHSAKGLEFHTVFVARVRPQYGFPIKQQAEKRRDVDIPDDFLDRQPQEHANEERRLFYVACTRAKKRLVLIAKEKKTEDKSKTVDYFTELTRGAPELGFVRTDDSQWLERAELADAAAEREAAELREQSETPPIDAELARARHLAFACLHEAREAGGDEASLERVRKGLIDAADEIAALSELKSKGTLPAFARPGAPRHGIVADAVARIQRATAMMAGAERIAFRAPLSLSYSSISDYLTCPRCWYLQRALGLTRAATSSLSIGSTVHAALQEFYTALINAEGDGRPVPVLADLLRMGEAHARRAFGPDDIDEVLRQIRAMLTNVLEALEDNAAEQIEAIERKTVYAYTAADGTTHTMDAKLDRVDRLRDRTVRVIDYKTGQASKKLLEPDAGDLQLGIYAMALPHLLQEPEIPAGVAEYWCLSEGKKGVINLADLKLDKVRKTIDKAAAGILNGEFLRGKECGGFCTLLG